MTYVYMEKISQKYNIQHTSIQTDTKMAIMRLKVQPLPQQKLGRGLLGNPKTYHSYSLS